LIFTTVAILLTLPIPLSLNLIGNPDNGIILAGYIALILLSASYIALGQFISINTKNQIVAFIVAASLIGTLYLFGEAQFLVFIPKSIRFIFEALGLGSHFRSIAKGVLDSRDILYYLSIIILLFYFTYRSLLRIKKKGK
jgi:ABC-2 type transport system permease protein